VTKHGIVYRVPGMASVKVRRDIALVGVPKLDLYMPAGAKPGKLPVVVFINGVGDRPDSRLKDWPGRMSSRPAGGRSTRWPVALP
jgi:hypothetical protein